MTDLPKHTIEGENRAPGRKDAEVPHRRTLRQKLGAFWLNALFWSAAHAPWLARWTVDFWVWAGWTFSPTMRRNTMANASHVLGDQSTMGQQRKLARAMIRSSFLFVYDVGRHSRMSRPQMRQEVRQILGQANYDQARSLKRGIIIATAHFGAFEGAVAALRDRESKIHVVFQRDRFNQFDVVRSKLHDVLGVTEAPIDDGVRSWLNIRDALLHDEAVLIQADRVMPGQRGMPMPFFNGQVEIPIGPAKLALLTNSPIVPIFAIRAANGSLTIEIQPLIEVAPAHDDPLRSIVTEITRAIEGMIRRHPQQWLMLYQPWILDGTVPQATNGATVPEGAPMVELGSP